MNLSSTLQINTMNRTCQGNSPYSGKNKLFTQSNKVSFTSKEELCQKVGAEVIEQAKRLSEYSNAELPVLLDKLNMNDPKDRNILEYLNEVYPQTREAVLGRLKISTDRFKNLINCLKTESAERGQLFSIFGLASTGCAISKLFFENGLQMIPNTGVVMFSISSGVCYFLMRQKDKLLKIAEANSAKVNTLLEKISPKDNVVIDTIQKVTGNAASGAAGAANVVKPIAKKVSFVNIELSPHAPLHENIMEIAAGLNKTTSKKTEGNVTAVKAYCDLLNSKSIDGIDEKMILNSIMELVNPYCLNMEPNKLSKTREFAKTLNVSANMGNTDHRDILTGLSNCLGVLDPKGEQGTTLIIKEMVELNTAGNDIKLKIPHDISAPDAEQLDLAKKGKLNA